MKLKFCSNCITIKKIKCFLELKKNKRDYKIRKRCHSCRENKLLIPSCFIIYFN